VDKLSDDDFRRLTCKNPAGETPRCYGLLLTATPRQIAKVRDRGLLSSWCPVILPQTGAAFGTPATDHEKVLATWNAVVERALALRRKPTVHLAISDNDASLNAVKVTAEEMAGRSKQPEWYSWATSTCLKVAGILHHLKPTTPAEIAAETWADAVALTTWLIEAQARTIRAVGVRSPGLVKKFHPPRPEDSRRLKDMLLLRPWEAG
jgi:hypothetical protein